MTKTFHVVPRGVALVIGCNTFPTWNSYPGLFASLVTGNPVVVKPHPRAVLPLAITVQVAREVLAEAGFDPNLVLLAAEAPGEGLASTLALRPEVRIVDFTGSTEYGDWLEANARQAAVYTEKAGVNTVVVDSTDDFAGMCRNIGFSLTLYSGQMCTTPQNILIPAAGIDTDQGHKSFDEVAAGIAAAVGKLTARPGPGGRADRRDRQRRGAGAAGRGHARSASAVLESRDRDAPGATRRGGPYPDGRQARRRRRRDLRPGVVRADLVRRSPPTPPRTACEIFRATVRREGRADRGGLLDRRGGARRRRGRPRSTSGVHLSANLTGGVFVNQSAAFSDFHAQRREPGRQRRADRRRLRGQPVPHRPVPPPRLTPCTPTPTAPPAPTPPHPHPRPRPGCGGGGR